MSLIKNAIKNQISDADKLRSTDTTAIILEYDRTTETCKLKYENPKGEGYIYISDVSIANVSGGISFGGIHAGQKCSISFINDNIYNPIIRGFEQSYYLSRKNTDQGAYIADDEIYKVRTPEHIIAMNLDWIDESNDNLYKYESLCGIYNNKNIDFLAMNLVTTLDKYSDEEVGMTNLLNNSTVKLKDNGDIDIFTSNNCGIRLCKSTGNIKFYGNDIEFTSQKEDTEDKSISTPLKISQVMKICLGYDIIKETDVIVVNITDIIEASEEKSKYESLLSRIQTYNNLKDEYYDVYVDDNENITKYIDLFMQFRDEFTDVLDSMTE